ncbi:hypothetical protein M422DRAFT_61520 [Sphaerobolus stellatus SS14]|uniref:SH3 domain-containing protein n=1 Tax=Sphaerobolus stellatus (strain SS14) TaxID=990650 RepID=A0A0C9TRB5_SPHS4|nr:hypothetical protein M422DRAFT_61520 [Sphaerobolus stellatus SS14]
MQGLVLEQEYEAAAAEYEHYNNNLKAELPQFMEMATRFIEPLFHPYYYMQLNIFYLMLEKLQGFSEGRYSVPNTTAEIADEWQVRRGDIGERVEALSLTKRFVSTTKILATTRGAPAGSGLNRANTAASTKSTPSTPPSAAAAPPPYSATASSVATKRPPPPPPPLKQKPKPAVQYVVALYDFQAQADGDLSFNVGDRIEIVERTGSQDDWWTAKVRGLQGVFPGEIFQYT